MDGTPEARRGYSLSVPVIDTPEQTVATLVRRGGDGVPSPTGYPPRRRDQSVVDALVSECGYFERGSDGSRFPHDGQTVTVGE